MTTKHGQLVAKIQAEILTDPNSFDRIDASVIAERFQCTKRQAREAMKEIEGMEISEHGTLVRADWADYAENKRGCASKYEWFWT